MATRAKLTTKGFADYLERIAKAGRNVDQAAAEALNAGGQVLLDGMVRRVPKDTHNLASHLELTPAKQDGNYIFVEVGVRKNVDAETARYGNAQEYGWTSRIEGHIAGTSYIRATLDNDSRKAKKEMVLAFQRWLESL